jgi:hypothetical protein
MTTDTAQLGSLIKDALAEVEERLAERMTRMVNERNTRVIDATTALVAVVREEVGETTKAVETMSEHTTAIISGLRADLTTRRAYIDERLALVEARNEEHADLLSQLIPSYQPLVVAGRPLRELVTQQAALMEQSIRDRAALHTRLDQFWRWGVRILIAGALLAFVFGTLLFFVAARVFYNWFLVGAS